MSLHVALADAGLGYFTGPFGAVQVDFRTGRSSGPAMSWAIALPPFLFVLSEGASAPITATRFDQWLTYPTKRQFSKADRRQFYQPGDLRDTLVAKLFQDQRNISKTRAAYRHAEGRGEAAVAARCRMFCAAAGSAAFSVVAAPESRPDDVSCSPAAGKSVATLRPQHA
ncbi:hypothetical protein [Glycomyces sambucus]|uniref:hypothetical protein n=1 Tax=Glycomyces sambucus TaxID=380244 RepID=UPI00115F9A11|nr:hypothetical protein [Glycomyces sambucus]